MIIQTKAVATFNDGQQAMKGRPSSLPSIPSPLSPLPSPLSPLSSPLSPLPSPLSPFPSLKQITTNRFSVTWETLYFLYALWQDETPQEDANRWARHAPLYRPTLQAYPALLRLLQCLQRYQEINKNNNKDNKDKKSEAKIRTKRN